MPRYFMQLRDGTEELLDPDGSNMQINILKKKVLVAVRELISEDVKSVGLGTAANFEFPMTQEQIGDATGLTTVHVNRTLKSLDAHGALVRDPDRFQVVDWTAMWNRGVRP